jgi:hypothetical protein
MDSKWRRKRIAPWRRKGVSKPLDRLSQPRGRACREIRQRATASGQNIARAGPQKSPAGQTSGAKWGLTNNQMLYSNVNVRRNATERNRLLSKGERPNWVKVAKGNGRAKSGGGRTGEAKLGKGKVAFRPPSFFVRLSRFDYLLPLCYPCPYVN